MANIAQIITGMSIGGAEKVVLELARGVTDHTQFFYLLDGRRNELLPGAEQCGAKFTALGLRKNPLSFLRALVRLLTQIKRHKITVLHAHMFHSLLLACVAKLCKPSLQIVYTYHLSHAKFHLRQHVMWWLKPFRHTDIVFTPQTAYYHRKGARQAVIPNGIDTARFDTERPKCDLFTFITVGRLEPAKNHLDLIHAFAAFKGQPVQLRIVGTGYLEPQLRDAISQHGLESQTHLLGARHDIPDLLCESHVFVLPSIEEGLPIALLEAGAAALPVITTPVGSIPTLINDSSGVLASVAEFPERMQQAIDQYDQVVHKGAVLQQQIHQTYSASAMAQQHMALYTALENG